MPDVVFYISDFVARGTYPVTVAVGILWIGIAIAHATNGGRLRYLILAAAATSGAIAFSLLSGNVWAALFPDMRVIMLWFRLAMAGFTYAMLAFTILYLLAQRRYSKRVANLPTTRPQEEPTA